MSAGWSEVGGDRGVFVVCGLLGYLQGSMETLIVTVIAVAVSAVHGAPLGGVGGARWRPLRGPPGAGHHADGAVVRLPAAARAAFGIGAPAAVISTMIYSLPPMSASRRSASAGCRRARWRRPRSLGRGSGRGCTRSRCRWPRTILVGQNQTTITALSMHHRAPWSVPGLGQQVFRGPAPLGSAAHSSPGFPSWCWPRAGPCRPPPPASTPSASRPRPGQGGRPWCATSGSSAARCWTIITVSVPHLRVGPPSRRSSSAGRLGLSNRVQTPSSWISVAPSARHPCSNWIQPTQSSTRSEHLIAAPA